MRQCGVEVDFGEDYMIVKGIKKVRGGQLINTFNDHRIAMSFAVLGSKIGKLHINESESISTSFPNFKDKFNKAGGNLS